MFLLFSSSSLFSIALFSKALILRSSSTWFPGTGSLNSLRKNITVKSLFLLLVETFNIKLGGKGIA
jgi:hypothetical protein